MTISRNKGKEKKALPYNRLISKNSEDYSINFLVERKKREESKIGVILFVIGLLFIAACLIVYFTTTMASKPTDGVSEEELKLISQLSAGNVEFAKKFYSIVSREPGNVFCSPLSLQLAILLAYNGANGNTSAEIKTALSLPDSKDDVLKGAAALIKLFKLTDNVTLNIANGIFLGENFNVKDSYVESTKKHFSALARKVDFNNKQQAANIINGFVDEHTNHKIQELFSPDAFDSLTRVVLVNAVYFMGNWAKRFKPEATYKGDFNLNNKIKVKTDFMCQTSHFEVADDLELNVTIVKLPYAGNDVSMILLIPKDIEGLPELEAKFNDIDLVGLASNKTLRRREINLHLPKFKLEKTLNLEPVVAELGMGEMLSIGKANFSDITEDNDIYVQKVVQKTYIDVDEKGTEAAAATGLMMVKMSLPLPPPELKVNSPFLFYLQHKLGSILFTGRITDPTKE